MRPTAFFHRLVLAGAFIVLVANPARAANLITQNPNFDGSTTNPWTFCCTGGVSYSPLDVAGSPSSGSGLVTNTFTNVGAAAISQCVTGITGSTLYDLGASTFIPSGQTGTGNTYVAYFFYEFSNCTGNNSGNFTPAVSTFNTWTLTTLTNVTSPSFATAVLIQLSVSKTSVTGQLEANFDRAFVGPPGTTPVSLVRFTAE